jgi:hypothetical protein
MVGQSSCSENGFKSIGFQTRDKVRGYKIKNVDIIMARKGTLTWRNVIQRPMRKRNDFGRLASSHFETI